MIVRNRVDQCYGNRNVREKGSKSVLRIAANRPDSPDLDLLLSFGNGERSVMFEDLELQCGSDNPQSA